MRIESLLQRSRDARRAAVPSPYADAAFHIGRSALEDERASHRLAALAQRRELLGRSIAERVRDPRADEGEAVAGDQLRLVAVGCRAPRDERFANGPREQPLP